MKEVMISIKGYQAQPEEKLEGQTDDKTCTELITSGEYSCEGGVASFSYMESEITGMAGTSTRFLVENDVITLTRSGKVNSEMLFSVGQRSNFLYDTEFGSLTLGVNTYSIYARLDENGGTLEIHYGIDVENMAVSRNSFIISIKAPQDSSEFKPTVV